MSGRWHYDELSGFVVDDDGEQVALAPDGHGPEIAALPELREAADALVGWVGILCKEFDVDPETTTVSASGVTEDGQTRLLGVRRLSEALDDARAVLSKAGASHG